MEASKRDRLTQLAQAIADETGGFFETAGPGAGDLRASTFMQELRLRAENSFGQDYSEQRICGNSNLAVDFFFPEESVIVEVALSLRFPNSEFERDILKAMMAKELDHSVSQLLFLSKPGAREKHRQPSSRDIIAWVEPLKS